jgi:hypothetical protein
MLVLIATWIPTSVLLWSYFAFLYLLELVDKVKKWVRNMYRRLTEPTPLYVYAPVNEPPRLLSAAADTPGVLYRQADKTLVKVPASEQRTRLKRLPWVQCELLAGPDGITIDMQEWLDMFRYNVEPNAELLQWILAVEAGITLDAMGRTVVVVRKIDDTEVRFTWNNVDQATYMAALA